MLTEIDEKDDCHLLYLLQWDDQAWRLPFSSESSLDVAMLALATEDTSLNRMPAEPGAVKEQVRSPHPRVSAAGTLWKYISHKRQGRDPIQTRSNVRWAPRSWGELVRRGRQHSNRTAIPLPPHRRISPEIADHSVTRERSLWQSWWVLGPRRGLRQDVGWPDWQRPQGKGKVRSSPAVERQDVPPPISERLAELRPRTR